jgi:uncharacterized protein (TIGR02145 family)
MMGERKFYHRLGKIIFVVVFAISLNSISAQTMVIKKADGTYVQTAITNAVEVYFSHPCPGTPTVDYSGLTYNTVQIGTQCWLKENLNVGTMLNYSSDQTNNSTIEKYCYNNDPANCTTYGGLYQWDEAMQYVTTAGAQGICPGGWHIPTDAEFFTLQSTVGNNNSLINVGQGSGTNISGFSALFVGYVDVAGSAWNQFGSWTGLWSSSEASGLKAYNLLFQGSSVGISDQPKSLGYSIRCIKD